jgi:hypothetical protein
VQAIEEPAATVLLTDRVVDRLPEGVIVRESKQAGLLVRVGKRTRACRYELAHRVATRSQRCLCSRTIVGRRGQ